MQSRYRSVLAGLILAVSTATFCQKDPMVGGAAMYANKNIVENALNSWSRCDPFGSPVGFAVLPPVAYNCSEVPEEAGAEWRWSLLLFTSRMALSTWWMRYCCRTESIAQDLPTHATPPHNSREEWLIFISLRRVGAPMARACWRILSLRRNRRRAWRQYPACLWRSSRRAWARSR